MSKPAAWARRAASANEPAPASPERLLARLAELRLRNPRHHRALALLYEEQATPAEAADELGVDVWTLRSLAARARLALAQSLERAEQRKRPGNSRGGGPRRRAKSQHGRPRRIVD